MFRNAVATAWQQAAGYTAQMDARLVALALALACGAHAAVILRSPEASFKPVADKLHSTVIDGERPRAGLRRRRDGGGRKSDARDGHVARERARGHDAARGCPA